ncbi:MAG: C4-dicarboxylate transporter DcuC [Zavarzinella sp.]|nr:C4-dicarboxylate transporter DcuC [Zavarzinella sp.]
MPDLGVVLLPLAAAVIAATVYAIYRGLDVRLALLVAAFALAGLGGDVAPVVHEFLATFSNEKFVVPICTAMGFAYVLRHTECDQHLVRLLTRPLRSARLFLIPGVVVVGFLVNIPVISQTSTAVCLGAVVVPLMRAARLSSVTIGASLLLGASIGGELLNPGAPELNSVGQRLGVSSTQIVPEVVPVVFPHLAVATAIFWVLCLRAERRAVAEAAVTPVADGLASPAPEFRVNLLRALVPLLPLVLLFLAGPPLNVIRVPERWLVSPKESSYETRLIGAAMLVGVLAAALAHPARIRGVAKAFFDGAGYAFAEVISLIVTASCFGKAVEQIGLAALIGEAIQRVPELLIPVAGFVPLGFAALSGSGMAATQSLYGFFVDPATAVGADPKQVGAVVSVGAAAGRTMSPVAAVALMSAKLAGTDSFQLARRVAGPLLISLAVIIALRMSRLM